MWWSDEPNRPKTEYELLREKNIRELAAFMAMDEDGENGIAEANDALKDFAVSLEQSRQPAPKRRKRLSGDPTFRFNGQIPQERRKSSRLAGTNPQFSYTDLPDEENTLRKRLSKSRSASDEEFRTTKRRRLTASSEVACFTFEGPGRDREVTENDLRNIAASSHKIYGVGGTTCHQCRQKTLDTKTFCRNPKCVGIRGQVCGPCLINRYGEYVADALCNLKWTCPCCRQTCNCSFCRTKKGKRPTGIMAPEVQKEGYRSVAEFLATVEEPADQGVGENSDEDDPEEINSTKNIENHSTNNNVSPKIRKSNRIIKVKWPSGKKIETQKDIVQKKNHEPAEISLQDGQPGTSGRIRTSGRKRRWPRTCSLCIHTATTQGFELVDEGHIKTACRYVKDQFEEVLDQAGDVDDETPLLGFAPRGPDCLGFSATRVFEQRYVRH